MKFLKKFLSAMCAAVLLFSAVPQALAATSPTLYFSGGTVYTGGGSTWCYLRMSGAESIAAMDYIITYDADNLEFVNHYAQGFTSQSDVSMSVNTDNLGEIHVMLVSQNGLNGSNILNALIFKAKSGAKAGAYRLSVLVNDIYNMSLETVIAEKQSGTVTVKEGSPTVKNVYFSNTLSASDVTVGDSFDYKLRASSLNDLSAGMLDFYYDETKLYLNSVTLSNAIPKATSDVNQKIAGLVKVSFASSDAITSGTNFITLNFSATAAGTAAISFKPSELYDSNFEGMTGSECSASVKIAEPVVAVDYADFSIVLSETVPSDREFTAKAVLEGGSSVCAGDFTIKYDSDALECVGVSAESVSGVWTTTDKNYSSGKVRFSFMANNALESDTALVLMKFKAKENKDFKSDLSISGTGVYDGEYNPITLEYKGATANVVRPEYTVNFYDADGETLLFTQKVMSGNSAIPPKTDEVKKCDKVNHLKFVGWDKDYSVISDHADFTAVYEKEAHTAVGMAEVLPGIDTPGCSGGTKCIVCGEVITAQTVLPPKGASVTATLLKNGMLSVSGAVSDSETTENCVLLSVYDGTKLLQCVDISGYNQNKLSLNIADMQGANMVKIFRWASLGAMQPLSNAVTVDVKLSEPILSATLSRDGALTVSGTISNSETAENRVMLGIYDGSRLLDCVDISGYNQRKFSLTVGDMATADTVKIFRWGGSGAMTPMAEAVVVSVSVTEPVLCAKLSADGTLTIGGIISNDATTENCVMLGIYSGSKLLKCVDISAKPQNKLHIEIENMQGADMVKLFRWSSLESMTPLHGAVEVEVKQ